MEQLIIILIFAAIAVTNQLLKKSRQGNIPPPDDDWQPPVRPPSSRPVARQEETEEERMRRFMEALGVPANSPPPRKIVRPSQGPPPIQPHRPVQPSVVITRKTIRTPQVPPIAVAPPMPARQEPVTVVPLSSEPVSAFPESVPIAVETPVGESPAVLPQRAPAAGDASALNLPATVRAMLANRDSIRSAILLREILDPPRGLQSYR